MVGAAKSEVCSSPRMSETTGGEETHSASVWPRGRWSDGRPGWSAAEGAPRKFSGEAAVDC